MSNSLNKVTLIGNVGKDPEIHTTNDSREVATLSIATSEHWKDKSTGERKERTEWHKVVVFNEGLVRIIKEHVKKGSKLYVEGSLCTRKWTDQSNQERYATEIVLQNFNANLILLDTKNLDISTNLEPLKGNNNKHLDFDNSDNKLPF
jgi:single-strand DNA-binding protein